VAIAVLAIGSVPALAAGVNRVPRVRVKVSPTSGSATSVIAVSFRAPNAAEASNGRSYQVQALANHNQPAGSHCLEGLAQGIGDARAHQRVTVNLDPAGSPAGWCPGGYHGTVTEFQRPVCAPTVPCPQYIVFLGTLGKFRFRVSAGGDTRPPTFAGLESAVACTPGAQRPGETTPFTLTWKPATDPHTSSSAIVYQVYESTTAGGEDYAQPTWTTAPGATTFRTPGLPSHGSFYFVVRARDRAGNEDQNAVERHGVDPCL
jgi:hypothetical protein